MRTIIAGLLAILFTQTPAPALRIVVIEGEGAVNIIQQKTAVRPLVEVRDRNNVPVPGATVTFTVGTGQPAAFAGGAPTMTVTTNASGQAAATGFNAVRPGAVQIQVQAAHQGQTAGAMISQTNFATAAAATAAGAAVGAASGGAATTAGGGATAAAAGTAGAGAGGGISATTIAIVGAAVGGGAVAVTTLTKNNEGGGGNFDGYRGTFTGPYVFTNTGTGSVCVFNKTINGTMEMDLRTDRSGGAVRLTGTMTEVSASGTCIPTTVPVNFSVPDITASGGPSNLSFNSTRTVAANSTETWTFSGSFADNVVTGTLTFEQRQQTSTGNSTFNGLGNGSFSVTLTR